MLVLLVFRLFFLCRLIGTLITVIDIGTFFILLWLILLKILIQFMLC